MVLSIILYIIVTVTKILTGSTDPGVIPPQVFLT